MLANRGLPVVKETLGSSWFTDMNVHSSNRVGGEGQACVRADSPHPTPDGAPSHSYPAPHPGWAEAWAALGANPWVFSTMTQGYQLQFSHKPALSTSVPQHVVADSSGRGSSAALQRHYQWSGEGWPSGRLLLKLFCDPKKGQRPPSTLGLKRPEPVSVILLVQDAHDPKGTPGHKTRQLVCHSWPQRCLLPDTNLERALVLLSVPIWGQNLQVYGPPFRNLSGTPHIHKVHGRSPLTPSSMRPQGPQLFGQLVGMCPDTTDVPLPCFQTAAAHQEFWAAYKWKKEQTGAISGHSVPGYDPGLLYGINFPDHTVEWGHKGLPPPLSH